MARLVAAPFAVLLCVAALAAPAWSQSAPPVEPTPIPMVTEPTLARTNLTPLTGAVWLEQPSQADLQRLLPTPAAPAQVRRVAIEVSCWVRETGRLDCSVRNGKPKLRAYEDAALRATRLFRMAPRTTNGEATAGRVWRGAITFTLD